MPGPEDRAPSDAGERPLRRPDDIRRFLGVDVTPRPVEVRTVATAVRDGVRTDRVEYRTDDGDLVPAFRFAPEAAPSPPRPGVVVFHQHASRWHLGKSEVAGTVGDPLQAFGPALAARGVVVLAPDSICFEDRRRGVRGTEPHHDDLRQHADALAYRLVTGDTLARKVLQDAVVALSALTGTDGVDPARVGVLGHSYGGQTVLFLAAIDPRVRFACTSGAAGSYRAKMAADVSIERAMVVPGIARRLDVDTLLACAAPRPVLVVAGTADRHALDAADVAEAAAPAYRRAGAADALRCEVRPGGHDLTPERHELIVDWVAAQAAGTAAPTGRTDAVVPPAAG